MMRIQHFPLLLAFGLFASCASPKSAGTGDPVQSDPKHYKVEFENAHIRVIRATIGPHEKTPMHSHPANVVITLTDNATRETLLDGNAGSEVAGKARSVGSGPPITHAMENLGDTAMESIVIELKD